MPMSELELDRERVIQTLCAHYANDHLFTQELEVRFDSAYKAESRAELQRLVVSLPALPDTVPPPEPLHGMLFTGDTQLPERRHVVVMSELNKRGMWVPPRRTVVRAVMASVRFDLREARLAPGVTEFDVTVVMGEVKFLVPPGVAVECDGHAFMGVFDDQQSGSVDPQAPVVRITGMAVMGVVEVKTRLPRESALEAWRQRMLGRGTARS